MRIHIWVGALCAVGMASAGWAGDRKPDKEKRICRAQPGNSSIVPTTICHTAAEWDQIARARKERFNQTPDGTQRASSNRTN